MFFTKLNRATLLVFVVLILVSVNAFADNSEHICGIHCNDITTGNEQIRVDLVANQKPNQPEPVFSDERNIGVLPNIGNKSALFVSGGGGNNTEGLDDRTFFVHDQEYRMEGACWRECIHGDDFSQSTPAYSYYYDEHRCSECGKVIETEYTYHCKNDGDECLEIYSVYRDTTCDECEKCKRCNKLTSQKKHYDYILTTKRCKTCGRSGYFSQPETEKEGPRTGVCVWKYPEDRSEVGECCLLCPACENPGDKNVHIRTTITKYTQCGHTKKYVDDNDGAGHFGHCWTKTEKGGNYCGGYNDQNDPCLCLFEKISKWKGLLINLHICKGTKGGLAHSWYTFHTYSCKGCSNIWFDIKKTLGYGECGMHPLLPWVHNKPDSCKLCAK